MELVQKIERSLQAQKKEIEQIIVSQSFRYDTGGMIELKKDLISNLFEKPIFEYFTKLEKVKV